MPDRDAASPAVPSRVDAAGASVTTSRSNAASAHRGRSCPPSRCSTASRRCPDQRSGTDERQPVPLRRLQQHRRRDRRGVPPRSRSSTCTLRTPIPALALLSQPGAAALAGGTTLLDLMKIDVETPTSVVDIQALPWKDIRVDDGALSVGALSSNTAVADHPLVSEHTSAKADARRRGTTSPRPRRPLRV